MPEVRGSRLVDVRRPRAHRNYRWWREQEGSPLDSVWCARRRRACRVRVVLSLFTTELADRLRFLCCQLGALMVTELLDAGHVRLSPDHDLPADPERSMSTGRSVEAPRRRRHGARASPCSGVVRGSILA